MDNVLLEMLIKEYDIMRSEIRLYINKFYLALTAVLAIFTAGLFKNNPENGGFIYIWIPYIIAGLVGFMSMVTFFINKTAGYVRLIERRIARIFGTKPPSKNETSLNGNAKLAPMFWESYYADISMERDQGNQLKSIFAFPIAAMLLAGVSALLITMIYGYCARHEFMITKSEKTG